ncbi:hypothetical protein EC973_000787 [Apophysomyces ossiformis]|uniref:Uncharacterized protein n=1 Tax=Apophysomyces ossiformis TaxID=679940 RepID=A0A8H7BQY8_9FUNG|nr:hypothetical protein EC973_000787 [Apophysomyces ossiformis]
MYEQAFVTSETQRNISQLHFGSIIQTERQIELWMNKSNLWGPRTTSRESGQPKKGRLLWKLKNIYIEQLSGNDNVMTTIGYARKSRTIELPNTETRLTQKMVESLLTSGRYSKVYVSTECNTLWEVVPGVVFFIK